MERVGIKTLKNRLSEYVRAAAAGRTVLVTDRGRVVAELIAPRASPDAPHDEQKLGELMQLGLLSPAKEEPWQPVPSRRPTTTLDELLRDLDDSRASR
jgi:prevent-host-death family protein